MDSTYLTGVAQRVRDEIDAFVVPIPNPQQLGTPLPETWFRAQIIEMKKALVEPFVFGLPGGSEQVVIVAEDEGVMLAYAPHPEGDFALIFKSADTLAPSHIRGSAVDCFLAR